MFSSGICDAGLYRSIPYSARQHLVLSKSSRTQTGREGVWQEKVGAQRVRVLVFSFLCVYDFPLGLLFSFGFLVFLWVYVVPLGLCYSKVLSGLGIYYSDVLSSLGTRLYEMEEESCASRTGPGRSCGRNTHFSPPLPLGLAEDLAVAGGRR